MEQPMVDVDGDFVGLVRRPAGQGAAPAAAAAARKQEQPSKNEDELVLSEVHLECKWTSRSSSSHQGHPSASAGSAGGLLTSTFVTASGEEVVSVQHALGTPLRSVGLQVWRGALLLADYLLQQMEQERRQLAGCATSNGCWAAAVPPLHGATALELGAGSGLAGLVLSAAAHHVYLTDVGAEVLANCQHNVRRHQRRHLPPPFSAAVSSLVAPGSSGASQIAVRQLDWLDPPDWLVDEQASPQQLSRSQQQGRPEQQQQQQQGTAQQQQQHEQQPSPGGHANGAGSWSWQVEDVQAVRHLSLLLAADPVYEDHVTEGFMRSALLLMRYAARHSGRRPRLLVALERRVVFTLREGEARAPAYDYWRTLFRAEAEPEAAPSAGPHAATDGAAGCTAEAAATAGGGEELEQHSAVFPLVGRRLDVAAIPQMLHPYDRSDQLELWELTLENE